MAPTSLKRLSKVEIKLTIHRGRGLTAKDKNMFGKKTSSDPYINIYLGNHLQAKTKVKPKTLDPVWNETFNFALTPEQVKKLAKKEIKLCIYDKDEITDDDAMGTVILPLNFADQPPAVTQWYPVRNGTGKDASRNAKGDLEISLEMLASRSPEIQRGNVFPLRTPSIRIGVAWDMGPGGEAIDVDTSCVAVDRLGSVLLQETVYYGILMNSNHSVRHSGDEREGDEEGDDESISCDLDRVPPQVLALYFLLTVATPGKSLHSIQSALVRVVDTRTNAGLCQFVPSTTAGNDEGTAMFLLRVARPEGGGTGPWVASPIEDTHPTARDFGTLIPQIKSYTRDLVPSIQVDPHERVAVMRKGGTIRVKDYLPSKDALPEWVTLGLAWDVTNGKNIDLDASAVCLDENFAVVDTVWFRQLASQDGSIRHSGDEREGDAVGDDEKISVNLRQVSPQVKYIGIIINSFTGQELDDVARAKCHLFDSQNPHADIATYTLSNSHELDKHTALVMGCLYRSSSDFGEWYLHIVSKAAQGRTVQDNVDELQVYLLQHPLQTPSPDDEDEIVVNAMPPPSPMVEEDEVVVMPLHQMGGLNVK